MLLFSSGSYVSIPQKQTEMQQLAINSLSAFCSCASAFVCVAPDCIHHETGQLCDVSTYRKRMWCVSNEL